MIDEQREEMKDKQMTPPRSLQRPQAVEMEEKGKRRLKQKRGENNTSTRNYPKEKKMITRQQWQKNVFSS